MVKPTASLFAAAASPAQRALGRIGGRSAHVRAAKKRFDLHPNHTYIPVGLASPARHPGLDPLEII